jgi:hypothetical protein
MQAKIRLLMLALAASLGACGTAQASNYTYTVDFDIQDATLGQDTVTGQIVTNCTSCPLDTSSLVSWSLSDTDGAIGSSTGANALVVVKDAPPSPLTISSTSIVYTPRDNGGKSIITFFGDTKAATPFFAFRTGAENSIIVQGDNEAVDDPAAALTIATAPVPLPSTLWLFIGGLASFGLIRSRRTTGRRPQFVTMS